ncbi:MAG TPA: Crp/Fnr family transcriptional regulator, partial [Aquaticitalea sp.]|nr:Crp/Fnr family transcriptional regulator [Aquaticitalea sp.]
EESNTTVKTYSKNRIIFEEGERANFYYQIKEGQLKMFNQTEDGKEFVQGYFENGDSFGEPPLFCDAAYPASAVCITKCSIFVLSKSDFFELLKKNPEIHLEFTKAISKRMVYKAKMAKEVSIHPPEHRILTLLNHLKSATQSTQMYEVPLTRQQISELTGLRVETVIRAIKKLEKSKKLSIRERRVFL